MSREKLLAATSACIAGTWLPFGPVSYTRGTGDPVTVTNTFSILNPNTQYTLKAINGGLQNDTTEYVSETIVTLNGVTIISSSNFNQNVAEVDVPVTLQSTNTLSVVVRGKPGGVLTLEVVGVDNDPPTIKATPSPAPNAAGWNSTNVTVTFTCNDATSGVASCPAAQTVTTEGSTTVSGTATDNAGNTASTSLIVQIDKTPPTITASASLAANSDGWNNANVTVTFTCTDSLSGVATCPSPATVSSEAANQVISGTAVDVAGNTASASATISLDKTPPTVSITSPADGSTSTAPSISVTGNVSDALSGVASVACNGIAATIQSGTFTCSVSLAVGSNSITALATDVAGNPYSATVSVTRSNPLSLTSLSPTSGPVGTSVTISGAGFGATQGSSTVTFNGTPANPTSWSDTQILVPVPTGATTGPVIVTVSAQASNALTFGVGTPPTISASASPAPNAAGWNNSPVTVTFTCTAGSAPIATCPSPQLVLTEGANQPISGTATDTDGTSTTTTIHLNIDKTKPVLIITSPTDGSTASSGSQTVIGTVADSLSGLSAVSCNGTSVPLSGGNFSCNISLNVGVNLIVVRATDVAGNVAGSNFHVSLPGTLPPPQTLTVTPSVANLVVGQTPILTAVDELGRPRDDATFTVSDPTIATISGDPTLTVIAPGPFTVTATVGGVSTSTNWNSSTGPLPQGTILWSAPTPPQGWTVVQIVQAIPTANGPDLYSVENTINSDTLPALTLVRGLTSDGRQLWATQMNGLSQAVNAAMADGNGGIIVELDPDFSVRPLPNAHVVNLDAQTGAVVWNQDTGSPFSEVLNGNQAVGPDGTLYSFLTPAADGATGAPVSSPYSPVQVPNSSAAIQVAPQNPCSSVTKSFPPGFAPPTIDADGSLLTLTSQSNLVYTSTCTGTGSLVQLSATYSLARVTPSGSYTLTPYYTQTNANIVPAQPAPQLSPYACLEVFIQTTFEGCRVAVGSNSLIVQSLAPTVQPFRPIPDGQGGALIPARIQDPNNPGAALAHVFHIPSSGPVVDIVIPLPAPGVQQTILNTGTRNFDLVLGENNVAFATDGINLASFNFTTGQILWTYQSSSISKAIRLIASASGNSLATKISDISNTASFGQESVLRFDPSGNVTPDGWTASLIDYWAGNLWPALPTTTGGTSGYSANLVQFSTTGWFSPDMEGSHASVQNLHVSDASSTGPNQAVIVSVFGKIKTALDAESTSSTPVCSSWLKEGSTVIQTLLIGNDPAHPSNNFGHGVFDIPTISAVHGGNSKNPDGTPIGIPNNFSITVNDNGAFFNATDPKGRSFLVGKRQYAGNTLKAQATILIHELAHVLADASVGASGFQNDFGMPKAGEANNALVDKNCRSLIEGLQ